LVSEQRATRAIDRPLRVLEVPGARFCHFQVLIRPGMPIPPPPPHHRVCDGV
jgi:hypothetical protein